MITRANYNCTDTAATWALRDLLMPQLSPAAAETYRAQIALEAPAMSVSRRGIRIDTAARRELCAELLDDATAIRADITAVAGREINPQAPGQQKDFFFKHLGLESMRNRQGIVSCDREVLERIIGGRVKGSTPDGRALAANVAQLLLNARDCYKAASFLNASLHNGRCRFNLRPAGTVSWRFSAQKSPRGDGLNIQQIPKKLRRVFVPDPGWTMGQCDQQQAESRVVAWYSQDAAYMAAHDSFDTHTLVARMIWPQAEWPTDEKAARDFAELPNFIRTYTRRDLSKRVQHGSNYGATEHALCRTLHIPLNAARAILAGYRKAFPGIFDWHERVRAELCSQGTVTYPWGYTRRVTEKPRDPATFRSVIASIPQAAVAWTNHASFMKAWLMESDVFQVLAHTHDGLLFQYKDETVIEQLKIVLNAIRWDDGLHIPFEFKLGGKNWLDVS